MPFRKIFTTAFLTMSAVTAFTPVGNHKRPLRSTRNKCGNLDKCFLLNIDTGKQMSLSDHGAIAIDSPTSRHTVVCDTNGNIEEVTFEYNGQIQIEHVKPWSMAGDTVNNTQTVPYLTTPGEKEIKLTGKFGNSVCFNESYTYSVCSNMSDVPNRQNDLTTDDDADNILAGTGDKIYIIIVAPTPSIITAPEANISDKPCTTGSPWTFTTTTSEITIVDTSNGSSVILTPPMENVKTAIVLSCPETIVDTSNRSSVILTPPMENVTKAIVRSCPEHGTVSVNVDGSISFFPNEDFDGMDTFAAEFCNVENSCTTQLYTMHVTSNTKPHQKSSNKTGLAGLAVFPVIFVVIVAGMYCRNKHRAKQPNTSHHVSVAPEQSFLNITNTLVENNTNPLDPQIQTTNQVLQSLNEPSDGKHHTTSEPILGNRTQEQDGVNGVWPMFKDQCRNPPNAIPEAEAVSEAMAVSEAVAVPEAEVPAHHNMPQAFAILLESDGVFVKNELSVGNGNNNTASGPTLNNSVTQEQDGVVNGIWPIYKDQCRNPPRVIPTALSGVIQNNPPGIRRPDRRLIHGPKTIFLEL